MSAKKDKSANLKHWMIRDAPQELILRVKHYAIDHQMTTAEAINVLVGRGFEILATHDRGDMDIEEPFPASKHKEQPISR